MSSNEVLPEWEPGEALAFPLPSGSWARLLTGPQARYGSNASGMGFCNLQVWVWGPDRSIRTRNFGQCGALCYQSFHAVVYFNALNFLLVSYWLSVIHLVNRKKIENHPKKQEQRFYRSYLVSECKSDSFCQSVSESWFQSVTFS